MTDVRRARRWAVLAAPAVALGLLVAGSTVPAEATILSSTPSAPYSYLARQPLNSKIPVRWYPCRSHKYKIYAGGSTSAQRKVLFNAVARLAATSGIPMVFAGWTSVLPTRSNSGSLPRKAGADIVIAFTTPGRTDLLPTSSAGLLGVGGSSYAWVGTNKAWYVSGYAVFNLRKMPGTNIGRMRMFEHELGHTLGLSHTSLISDVMYPVQYSSSPDWSTGFARGLVAIGKEAGCATT